jgi:hypothetical protein
MSEDIIIIDADDFHEGNHKLDLLERIHKETGMLFNLFTIPGLCSEAFIREVQQIPWIDMIPHGWRHETSRECQWWGYYACAQYLDKIAQLGLTKGFKAPGWQISIDMYVALIERGCWVADQHYNDRRRPEKLKAFFCNPEHHFHIGHMGGYNENEIELHLERLLQMRGEFKFIKDVI